MVGYEAAKKAVAKLRYSITRIFDWRRKLVCLVLVLILGLGLVEALSGGLCWFLRSRSNAARFIFHPQAPALRADGFARASDIDNDIGGAPIFSLASGAPRDRTGAKINTEFPDPERNCGSAFGESLVLGYEVPPEDGWVERLSHRLGCRVSNYAVNNYSPDQAYRRFELTRQFTSFVILGIDPSTILDVVSQYTALIRPPSGFQALKGRYVLDPHGRLKWLPRVLLDHESYAALHRYPAKVLQYEYFLPDSRDGPITERFPYLWTVVRLAMLSRVQARLSGRAEWSGFYAAQHPSGALPLLEAICSTFARDATAQGERPLIVILPVAASFRMQARFGRFEYSPLVDDLKAHNVPVFDLGPAMLDALHGRSFCELFVSPQACRGHYSVLGNVIVARAVAGELRRRDYSRR